MNFKLIYEKALGENQDKHRYTSNTSLYAALSVDV